MIDLTLLGGDDVDIHAEFTVGSLFTGTGGLDVAIKMSIPNATTKFYVEKDRYAQAVLMSRIRSKELDDAPIWDDVLTFDGGQFAGQVNMLIGGFPCQDISPANPNGKGIAGGEKSGLWFRFRDIICDIRPSFVFVENSTELSNKGIDIVLAQLSEIGYNAEWEAVSASAVGSPQERERIFLLAYTDSARLVAGSLSKGRRHCDSDSQLGDTMRSGFSGESRRRTREHFQNGHAQPETFWSDGRIIEICGRRRLVKPGVYCLANGVAYRMDRVRCHGLGVVPQQAALAFQILSERMNQ